MSPVGDERGVMKATRVLVFGLMVGLCAAACDQGGSDKSEKESSKKDDGDEDDEGKKKKKKKGKKGKKGDGKEAAASDSAEKKADAKPAADNKAADNKAAGDNKQGGGSGSNTAAAPEPAAPAEPAQKCGSLKDIPDIPEGRSAPPKDLAEWNTGCKVNTQGPNSHAPDCTAILKREWLKVTCTGDMLGFEQMDGFGVEGNDYFKMHTPGKLLSFVVRLRKGQSQKVRMCRPKERASLFVSWPPGKSKPTIIAVGRGPKCDNSAWGG